MSGLLPADAVALGIGAFLGMGSILGELFLGVPLYCQLKSLLRLTPSATIPRVSTPLFCLHAVAVGSLPGVYVYVCLLRGGFYYRCRIPVSGWKGGS
jgi:hypothetical protein